MGKWAWYLKWIYYTPIIDSNYNIVNINELSEESKNINPEKEKNILTNPQVW